MQENNLHKLFWIFIIFGFLIDVVFGTGTNDIMNQIGKSAEDASKQIFGVAAIISKTIGVVYLVALGVGALFARQQMKDHIWLIVGSAIVLTIVISVCQALS